MSQPRILVVCTANVCRSPMAAALLTRHLDAVGVPAAVTSAGIDSFRLPVDPVAVQVMARWRIDIAAHEPRVVTSEILAEDGADLVLAMTREHLRHVVLSERSCWPRTFTARELVRRMEGIGSTVSIAEWVAAVGAGRRPIDVLGEDRTDDVADPYGRGYEAVLRAAVELDELTRRIAAALSEVG